MSTSKRIFLACAGQILKMTVLNACGYMYRPKRLPRPLSGIVIAVIYHPPCLPVKEHDDLSEYLINTAQIDKICIKT